MIIIDSTAYRACHTGQDDTDLTSTGQG
jgi:hypothetical protein